MPRGKRAPFVPLVALVNDRQAGTDARAAIAEGRVVVDGRVITNPRAQVRKDASVRVRAERPLRGEVKLGAALDALAFDVSGATAVDVGAAAGGFTRALLAAGAAKVYAVDVGFGQLAGSLRADDRVVNLERTNVARLDRTVVPGTVDLVTMDLSYLSVAEAVPQLAGLDFAAGARLLALVKPTFEMAASHVAVDDETVRAAAVRAVDGIARHGWEPIALTLPAVSGSQGAVELFALARRP